MTTLLDIAKANAGDPVVGLIEEVITTHPELSQGDARTIPGIDYDTLVRTALPGGSSFRQVNNGVDASYSTLENRKVSTYVLDRRWEADKAAADRYVDGAEAYIAIEAKGQMAKAMSDLGKQFYYGVVGADADAFPGLIDMYDSTNMVVDAEGSTNNTGSSVWFVTFGPQDVRWVWGQNGLLQPSDVRVERITGANGKVLDGYVQNIIAYPGLQVGSVNSVCRIKKLTADSGKGLTDKLINDALAKFPAGISPSCVFMSRRSALQLTNSRTATNITGTPAPVPVGLTGLAGQNIPIYITDSITDTESLSL